MSGVEGANTVYLVLLLVMVVSSLVASRLPLGKALKMALIWVALFGVVFMLFAFRGEFSTVGQRVRAELTGAPIVSGETMRIPISEDGHFWVTARINGRDVRLLVDSGASVTTIGAALARGIGAETGRRVPVQTANGTVAMARSRADSIVVGPISRNGLAILISPDDDLNVLGMNFLQSLSSWRVEGNDLVLTS